MCGGMKDLSSGGGDCGLSDVWNVCGELWFASTREINTASAMEFRLLTGDKAGEVKEGVGSRVDNAAPVSPLSSLLSSGPRPPGIRCGRGMFLSLSQGSPLWRLSCGTRSQ